MQAYSKLKYFRINFFCIERRDRDGGGGGGGGKRDEGGNLQLNAYSNKLDMKFRFLLDLKNNCIICCVSISY